MNRHFSRPMLLAAVLAVLLAASPAGAALWRLAVKDAACAAGPRVLLSEIAVPQGDMQPEAWATLGATPLWWSPEIVGRQVVLPADKVLEGLRYYLRDAPVEYVLPNQVAIMRGGRVLSGDELRTMAVETLTPRVESLGPEARLASVSVPDHLFVEDRATNVSVETGDMTPGKISFRFVVAAGEGRVFRKIMGEAVVEQWARVPVATRPLNPREPLNPQLNYVLERRSLVGVKGRIFEPGDGPWRARRGMSQGQIIMADDVEPRPLILRGEQVRLVYEGRSVRLALMAEAVTDGAAGGKITVKNPVSSREVVGVVRDRNTVVAH
jgi:flagellar basal body P-ring formation protein FlgA